jgi:catechol 2,3-dioxygenase-like lactoylglutathione lyase family enzyme
MVDEEVQKMPETKFRHLSHCCKDIRKTRRFYEELLGFKLKEARASEGDHVGKLLRMSSPFKVNLVFLEKDGLVLELQDFEFHGSVPQEEFFSNRLGLGFIRLDVKGLPEVLAKVAQYGGAILEDTNSGGSALVKDPDGQVVELTSMR